MSQAVEGVEGEGQGEGSLERQLCSEGPGGEGGGDGEGLEVEADKGRDGIGGAKGVHGACENDAGNAVGAGQVPGQLGLVDGEMGGDGTELALGDEDVVGLGGGGVGGGGGGGAGGCGSV